MRCVRWWVLGLVMAMGHSAGADEPPIQVDSDNAHWFRWRGETMALITSAEHYGAVIHRDFDFERYLDTLQCDGLNYTRVFAGTYVEPQGAFGIANNTLAPPPDRFLAPWQRSSVPVAGGKLPPLDLDRFSDEFLTRMKAFLRAAEARGIVVELTLFCSTYSEAQWKVSPYHPDNHRPSIAMEDWKRLHTLENGAWLERQSQLVAWLVRNLNEHDNLFFEIQNEPWADRSHLGEMINPYLLDKNAWPNAVQITDADSVAWQRAMARVIRQTEESLPQKHLIAQNISNFRLAIGAADGIEEADIYHFHYAYPEAVTWNAGLGKVIGYDETGFAGAADTTYRRQAYNFVFSGGGLFNNLDYSFSIGHEDGTDTQNKAPGGGSPALRRQLGVLADMLKTNALRHLRPDTEVVIASPGRVARALSQPGRTYLVYLEGNGAGRVELQLPSSDVEWKAVWIDATTGERTEPPVGIAMAPPGEKLRCRVDGAMWKGDGVLRVVAE